MAYNAVDYLFEDLASTREARQLNRQQAEDLAEAAAQTSAVDSSLTEADVTAEVVETAADEYKLPPQQIPVGAWSQGPLRAPNIFSGVAIVFLVSLIAAQWVFFNRAELAGHERWRSSLEQACKYLHCSLPMQVDLAQLELLNREIRQHPRVEEALLVNATLSNQAGFTQPFPVLEVSFSDVGGNPVAVRYFRPIEYVNDSYTIKRGMPPEEPVAVVLEILDPGEQAASYQFGFL